MSTIKILLVDDDPSLRNMLKHVLEKQGCEVIAVSDGSYAITALELCAREISGVITDMDMPDKTGMEVIQYMAAHEMHIPTFFHSANPQPAELDIAGVHHFVEFHDKVGSAGHIKKFIGRLADQPNKKK